MGDVEWIVYVDVPVRVVVKIIEDVLLQRVGWFHYERVQVKPPEPTTTEVSIETNAQTQQYLPFSLRISPHRVADCVNLLPAFPPFVSVPLLGTHINNREIVTPPSHILFLVPHAVSFDGPFPCSFPFHDTSTLIRCQYDHKLLPTSQMSAVESM